MFSTAFTVILLSFGVYYLIDFRDYIDWNKKFLYKVAPGPCKTVLEGGGSEDLTHIGDGEVLISSGLEFPTKRGSIKKLNVNTGHIIDMKINNAPDKDDFIKEMHGITTWKEPYTGQLFLYVLTHPASADRVEVFEMTSPSELTYIRSITDPGFNFMNDLVAVGRDKFYITRYWKYRNRYLWAAETYLRMGTGGVVYYDGKKARELVSGLQMPNGINLSPDGNMVYVAESVAKKLLGFKRDGSNNVHKVWEVYADNVLDNIEVDPKTGDLWVGGAPVLYRIMDPLLGLFGSSHPSQILRFKMQDNMVSEIEEIYADDSTEIAAASVATFVNGKLVIGSIYSKMLLCDVKYLSK